MDEKSKLKNDWKMTDEEMGNTNVPIIINKSYDELHQQLTDAIRKNNLDVDMDKISEAFTLAYESHIGQKRKSGEDYILHPVEVAEILVDMRMDTDTIVAGLLHDVVEDTLISLSDIEYNFGTDVFPISSSVIFQSFFNLLFSSISFTLLVSKKIHFIIKNSLFK